MKTKRQCSWCRSKAVVSRPSEMGLWWLCLACAFKYDLGSIEFGTLDPDGISLSTELNPSN